MLGRAMVVAVAALLAACAPFAGEDAERPVGVAETRPLAIRQPALFVEVAATEIDEAERARLARDYEGALLDALNAKAVAVRDIGGVAPGGRRVDAKAALARAREIGADAAILVRARVATEIVTVCQETGRPLRGRAVVWRQDVEVLRAGDGVMQLRLIDSPTLAAHEVEIDCDRPREARRAGVRSAMEAAIARLTTRLFGA